MKTVADREVKFRGRVHEILAPIVSSAALLTVLAAFVFALADFRASLFETARQDLDSRAKLASSSLDGAVRTMDFKAVNSLASSLASENLRLRISGGSAFVPPEDTAAKGFFDSGESAAAAPCFWGTARCGEYHLGVGRSRGEVLRPFERVLVAVLLSGLLGVLSMGVVFFTLYRQRVRIAELARIERFRRDFIADLSHEVKTPLTGLLGAADLLRGLSPGERDEPMREKLLGMVEAESRRLQKLMQQILDLARLERADEALQPEETDVGALARELAERRHVSWQGSRSPVVAKVDARLIESALDNLIANAFRHSGSADITLRLETGPKELRFIVEDHGIGIPSEHAERIFERFHRVDPSRAASSGGAGLGLAIVRRIARLHGGDVSYSPVAPHGARFTVSIVRRIAPSLGM